MCVLFGGFCVLFLFRKIGIAVILNTCETPSQCGELSKRVPRTLTTCSFDQQIQAVGREGIAELRSPQ